MATTAATVGYKVPLKMKRKYCVLATAPGLTVVFVITNTGLSRALANLFVSAKAKNDKNKQIIITQSNITLKVMLSH